MSLSYSIKPLVKATPVFDLIARYRKAKQIRNWYETGCLVPPPSVVKQSIVTGYARRFKIDTLIETGTFMGEMIDATKNVFKKIYSVELSEHLYERAKDRFSRYKNIELINGDSGQVLQALLSKIDNPCLFWLDGHYSGDGTASGELASPVLLELEAIFRAPYCNHVVLIDDARCFSGTEGYPTLDNLERLVRHKLPDWNYRVEHDIVRVLPSGWAV